MRALLCSFGLAAILGAEPSAAQAQSSDGAALQAFTKSAFYGGLVNRALSSLSPDVFRRCPALVSTGSRITTVKPVTFGADGFPNGGAWRQQFPVSGCGNDTTLNLEFQATPDEKIDTIVAAPGDSRADTTLQRDAFTFIAIAVGGTLEHCKTLNVKTTRFDGFGPENPRPSDPGATRQARPWSETWTMVGCGHVYDVPVEFIPRSAGTQIVQPGHVVER